MQQIYVLQCNNGKYYIGKTSNINRRFNEHVNGEYGSEWTKYYRPRQIIKSENMTSEFDEMKKTLEYMKKFGIDNVRGAQWSNINLTSKQRADIRKLMNINGCFRCGKTGHFANDCCKQKQSSRTAQCFKCGNYGHYANECHNNPNTAMQCHRCGSYSHLIDNCYATFHIDGNMLGCARCGRDSHSVDKCFATTDINGRYL